ncbi:unnamed protein product [Ectocarpus sp. 13 AM-2016]
MHRCLRKPFFRRWGMDNLASSDVQQEDQADMMESAGAGVVVERGIDKARSRYPYCIVWTPLPLITWFIPLIGHMGIADSRGVIYDFAGPYTIGEDHMAFGRPTRYLPLDPGRCKGEQWDESVAHSCETYSKRMHNLCCDNCHSHVALALKRMRYAGVESWNMVSLCFWIFFAGRYVSVSGFLVQWLPFGLALTLYLVLR